MSYRAGTFGLEPFGVESGPPRLICDGCGLKRSVQKPSGLPYSWLLNRKKAPGWTADFSGDMRKDWCVRCSEKREGDRHGSK